MRFGPRALVFRAMQRGRAGARSPSRWQLGRLGEEVAARYLLAQGWRLVGRNLRAQEGELDLVGRDGDVLVVVEVKTGWLPRTRAWERLRPGRHVGRVDIARRARAARRIAGRAHSRVDVIEVLAGRGPHGVEIVHHAAVQPRSLGRALARPPRPESWP